MPEYNCINIGVDGYPVWLTLSDKATVVVIEPTTYPDKVECLGASKTLLTTVSLVVDGCCVEAKTPATVESVCRILGFVWDETDVLAKPAPAGQGKAVPTEEPKLEGEPQ